MTRKGATTNQPAAVIADVTQLPVEYLRKTLQTTEVVVAEVNNGYGGIRDIRATSMDMRYRDAKQ